MKRLVWLSLSLLLLAGCAPMPQTVYYRVDYTPPPPRTEAQRLPLGLSVEPLKAPEALLQPNIIYRTSEVALQQYPYRLWEASPVELVGRHLVLGLRAAGLFERVVTDRLLSGADLTLRGRLLRFEEVDKDDGWWAQVALWLELEDGRAHQTIWSGQISREMKAAASTTEAVAEAMTKAVQECVDQAVVEIGQAAAKER